MTGAPGPRTASSSPWAGMPAGCPSPAPGTRSPTRTSRPSPACRGGVAVVGGADTGCRIASIFEDFGAAGMTLEQVAELQPAYPTFTEGVSMAAQKICRTIGIGRFPRVWSYLGSEE